MFLRGFALVVSVGLHVAVGLWLAVTSGIVSADYLRNDLLSGLRDRLERVERIVGVSAQVVPSEPEPVETVSAAIAPKEPVPPKAAAPAVTDYGAWRYACRARAGDGVGICSLSQTIVSQQARSPLLTWRITRGDDGGLVSLLQTPTDVKTDSGLVISVDAARNFRLPFEQCYAKGCIAEARMASDFAQLLVDARELAVTLFALNGQGVRLMLKTDGLADGLAALQAGETRASASP